MPGERRDLERVLHGVAHIAIAALAFPRPDDLANETYVGRVSVEQADTVVREACIMLASRAVAAEEAGDPLEDAPELERVWRVYSRRPEATLTKDGRVAPSTTRGVIGKALRFLADQGSWSSERRGRRHLPDHAALPGPGAGAGRRAGFR